MKKVIILFALFISSCGFINESKIEDCKRMCEPNGGISSIEFVVSQLTCHCKNNAQFYLGEVK